MTWKRYSVRDGKGRFAGADGSSPQAKPAAARKSYGAWTADKETTFFRELGLVCNVSAALKACGMLRWSSEVYERRKQDSSFRARWYEALQQSYALLELEMLERARFGSNRPAPQTDVEKRLREVPTGLGLQLLKLHQARTKSAPAAPTPGDDVAKRRTDGAALRREIDKMLSDFNRRMGGNG